MRDSPQMSNPNTDSHGIQIDILDGLRLLYAAATEEARPILKAATGEIIRLRGQAEVLQTAVNAMTLEIEQLHNEAGGAPGKSNDD